MDNIEHQDSLQNVYSELTAYFPEIFEDPQWHLEVMNKINLCPVTISSVQDSATVHYQAACYLLEKNKIRAAVSSLLTALHYNSTHAEALYCLGSTCFEAGLHFHHQHLLSHAIHYLMRCQECNRDFGPALFQLSKIFNCFDPGADTGQLLMRAAQLLPHSKEVFTDLVKHFMWNVGDFDSAVQAFEHLWKLDPTDLDLYDRLSLESVYLQGAVPPVVREHSERRKQRVLKRRKDLKIDEVPFRIIGGNVPPTIGHYSFIDDLAKLVDLGLVPERSYLMVAKSENVVNPALINYWAPRFPTITAPEFFNVLQPLRPVIDHNFAEDVEGFTERFNGDYFQLVYHAQELWEKENRPAQLALKESDNERGRACLERLGLPRDAWFVTVHFRDDGYYGPNPMNTLRNSNIQKLAPAFRAVTNKGGWIIRMGDPRMSKLPEMSQVIDYAHSDFKSDWMDVFLWAKSRFFVAGHSGPVWIPKCFGVPTLMVDWLPMTRSPWTTQSLMLPKLFYCEREKRYLTFSEMLDPNGKVACGWGTALLERHNLRCVDTTVEHFECGINEMIERIEGRVQYSVSENALHENLQAMAKDLCAKTGQGDRTARLCRHFLDQNRHLMD